MPNHRFHPFVLLPSCRLQVAGLAQAGEGVAGGSRFYFPHPHPPLELLSRKFFSGPQTYKDVRKAFV